MVLYGFMSAGNQKSRTPSGAPSSIIAMPSRSRSDSTRRQRASSQPERAANSAAVSTRQTDGRRHQVWRLADVWGFREGGGLCGGSSTARCGTVHIRALVLHTRARHAAPLAPPPPRTHSDAAQTTLRNSQHSALIGVELARN